MSVKSRLEEFHLTNNAYLNAKRTAKKDGKEDEKEAKPDFKLDKFKAVYKETTVYILKVHYYLSPFHERPYASHFASFSYSASEANMVIRHAKNLMRVNQYRSYDAVIKSIEDFCLLHNLNPKAMERHFSVVECKLLMANIPMGEIVTSKDVEKVVKKAKALDKKIKSIQKNA